MRQMPTDTQDLILEFGKKHRGERVQRVVASYLLWMVNELEQENPWRAIAEAELKRRGTVLPQIDISGHAIDRASLNPKVRAIWHETSNPDEGLHAWLVRAGQEARITGLVEKQGDDEVAYYGGIKWVFELGNNWPTLKTLMPKERRDTDDQ
jgi:hypothetical protein